MGTEPIQHKTVIRIKWLIVVHELVPMAVASVGNIPPNGANHATVNITGLPRIAAIRHAIAIVIGIGAVENLPVVHNAVAVAVGGPFNNTDSGSFPREVIPTTTPGGCPLKTVLAVSEIIRTVGGPSEPLERFFGHPPPAAGWLVIIWSVDVLIAANPHALAPNR